MLKQHIIKKFKTLKSIMKELDSDYDCLVVKKSPVDCSVIMKESRKEVFTFSLKEIS